MTNLLRFFLFWALNTLVLWAASEVFSSVHYTSVSALLIAALLFGLAQTFLKPVLVLLTLPVTFLTLGLFLLIVNGFILALVAWLVPGFTVGGFGQAILVGLFISVLSFVLSLFGLRK